MPSLCVRPGLRPNQATALNFAWRGIVLPVLWFSCSGPPSASAEAPFLDTRLWGTDGTVAAIARSGNILYLGGSFSMIGRCSGGGVPVGVSAGAPARLYPPVAGTIRAAVSDGAGGWFIGGYFSNVGGAPRSNLAHVLASGELSSWAPHANGGVWTLVLLKGVVYVGGAFQSVGGETRRSAAAIDARTGVVTNWNPSADSYVFSLAPSESTIYVGGEFGNVGGLPRNHIAELSLVTGASTAWDPGANGDVLALAVHDSSIYASGYFSAIGGQPRNLLGEISRSSGLATVFNPMVVGYQPSPYVSAPVVAALAVVDTVVLVGGNFVAIGGQPRLSIAALNVATGLANSWQADVGPSLAGFPPPTVDAISVSENTVYIGGEFTSVGGSEREHAAALDLQTAGLRSWHPRPNDVVFTIAQSDTNAFLGGAFGSLWDWQARNGLAAVDLSTGMATSWNPSLTGLLAIYAIAAHDTTVYVGGVFSGVEGTNRNGIAALDATRGGPTAWNPSPNGGSIRAIMPTDSAIFVAGDFTAIGGASRTYLAAIDPITALATAWAPNPNDIVVSLAQHNETLYVGGFFTDINGIARSHVAAVGASSGGLQSWNPGTDGIVSAMAVADTAVYLAGDFSVVGGKARNGVAGIDPVSGVVSPWDPLITGSEVGVTVGFAVAAHGQSVFFGGDFGQVGGENRTAFAVIDAATGLPENWDPASDGRVFCLASYGDTIYAGGSFHVMAGMPQSGVAAIILAGDRVAAPRLIGTSFIEPNPCQNNVFVRFAMPGPGQTSLSIFDLEGRRVMTVLDHAALPGGQQKIGLATTTLRAGCYVCRLTTPWFESARKMIVIR